MEFETSLAYVTLPLLETIIGYNGVKEEVSMEDISPSFVSEYRLESFSCTRRIVDAEVCRTLLLTFGMYETDACIPATAVLVTDLCC